MSRNKDIAILIPFRNEEENLVCLLDDLMRLNFGVEFEIILINDHSTDRSVEIIKNHGMAELVAILDLDRESFGKKKALERGVMYSSCDFFWSIDADVRIAKFDLEILKSCAHQSNELIILPVIMSSSFGFLNRFQRAEWQLLQAWTFFSAKMGFPIMANGANLLFSKKLFLSQSENRFGYLSGDDMNLLHQAIGSSSLVGFQNSPDCAVQINGVQTWRDYFVQRWRWSSKTRYYPKSAFHVLTILFSFWNLFILLGCVAVFFHVFFVIPLVVLIFIQVLLVQENQKRVNEKISITGHSIFALIFPFISLFFFITSQFVNVNWKGRNVSLRDDK